MLEGAECLCAGCGREGCLSPSLHQLTSACCACDVNLRLHNMLRCRDPLGPCLAQLAAGAGGIREARQVSVYSRFLSRCFKKGCRHPLYEQQAPP